MEGSVSGSDQLSGELTPEPSQERGIRYNEEAKYGKRLQKLSE